MPKVSLAGRPIGVVILSGLAFVASPAMVPLLVDSRLAVLSKNEFHPSLETWALSFVCVFF
jgi:hypothetical protein